VLAVVIIIFNFRELDLSIINIEEDSPDGDISTHPVIHSTTLPPTQSNITSFTPLGKI